MLIESLRSRARSEAGFSLIELLVVVLIIGILATLMVPRFLGQRDGANNSKPKTTVRAAVSAAEAFYAENETYTGFNNAALQSYEPGLTLVGTATGCVEATTACNAKGSGANPNDVYVDVAAGQVTICGVGSGDEAYCARLSSTAATGYSKDTDAGAADEANIADAAGGTFNTSAW